MMSHPYGWQNLLIVSFKTRIDPQPEYLMLYMCLCEHLQTSLSKKFMSPSLYSAHPGCYLLLRRIIMENWQPVAILEMSNLVNHCNGWFTSGLYLRHNTNRVRLPRENSPS